MNAEGGQSLYRRPEPGTTTKLDAAKLEQELRETADWLEERAGTLEQMVSKLRTEVVRMRMIANTYGA